jgi:hypothetical protein
MINQGPIVRYTASVCEIFFSDFRQKTFSAESQAKPVPFLVHTAEPSQSLPIASLTGDLEPVYVRVSFDNDS